MILCVSWKNFRVGTGLVLRLLVNSTHTIDYGIDTVSNGDNGAIIKINKIGNMPMPVDVTVTLNSGEVVNYYIPLDLMRGEKPVDAATKTMLIGPGLLPPMNCRQVQTCQTLHQSK